MPCLPRMRRSAFMAVEWNTRSTSPDYALEVVIATYIGTTFEASVCRRASALTAILLSLRRVTVEVLGDFVSPPFANLHCVVVVAHICCAAVAYCWKLGWLNASSFNFLFWSRNVPSLDKKSSSNVSKLWSRLTP